MPSRRKSHPAWVKHARGRGVANKWKGKSKPGTYGESKAEALERLAPLLRQVTEQHAARGDRHV